MAKQSEKNAVIRENQLDFQQDLYERGVELPLSKIQLLLNHKRIKLSKERTEQLNSRPLEELIKEEEESIIKADEDKQIESFDEFGNTDRFYINSDKSITKADWMPKDLIDHDDDFILWIDSINRGFQNMVKYDKFRKYCEQARKWIDEDTSVTSFKTKEQAKAYIMNEFARCKENTLYFMDKYLMYKEPSAVETQGMRSYIAKPVHKVICYMVDCGYSMEIGKPRQIAATTTLGGVAIAKLTLNKNYFIKMVAQDKEKVQEIYDDKIMFPFGELPKWFKPEVSNFRENFLRLSKKSGSKGTRKGVNSKLQVVAPSVSAINGGAPPLVLIDEAGYIGILGKMIKEARPTMFMTDAKTGKLKMTRQIIVWGTGGEMDKGGKAFETEFHSTLEHWNNRNFEQGIIPLFFDWTSRPGITRKFYEDERKVYTVEGPDKDSKMVQFRQTYPSIIEDMFLTSNKLLVSIDWINSNLERIKNLDHVLKPKKGYFEPIFSDKIADENSDLPYEVIGANFIPLDDTVDDMSRASTIMFMEPNKSWRNRYYQGTDPIMSDNGYSNMASVIFDNHYKTPACIMNYRDSNHKYTFLQTMLMGIYYNTSRNQKAVPELVESNIGTGYADYKESKGFGDSLVYKMQLPQTMQGGSQLIGIDNRANRSRFIINKMFEVIKHYGENFCISVIFTQLRTFTCTVTEKGTETWGTADARKYHDDVLYGLVFSYICTLCFDHEEPVEIKTESDKYRTTYKLVRENGKLTRREIRVPKNY
jgi:hypothetical protein